MTIRKEDSGFLSLLTQKKASRGDAFFSGLSPLAGVSDISFRRLCSDYGCDFAVTEMVSGKGLYYGDRSSETLLETDPGERAVGCQLFGSDPDIMAAVIREKINPRGDLAWIDLNMGCPVPKIVKNGDGSAMMKDPSLVYKVLKAMVDASDKPVTAKFRIGWDEEHKNYLEVGRAAQDAGVSLVTLHGRTREQMYHGTADWEPIRELVEALDIPVIGNGDVTDFDSARRMIETTGCAGVAIGRGAMGNPFIFREIRDLREGKTPRPVTIDERFDALIELYRRELEKKGQRIGMLEMRKHIGWWITGLFGSAKVKQRINAVSDSTAAIEILEEYRDSLKNRDEDAQEGEIV